MFLFLFLQPCSIFSFFLPSIKYLILIGFIRYFATVALLHSRISFIFYYFEFIFISLVYEGLENASFIGSLSSLRREERLLVV